MLTSVSPATLVRSARKKAGLTQAELAGRAGTTQPVVARAERNDAKPTLDTLERLLDAAGYELELRARPRPRPAVDESQIIERLGWTPAERLAAHGAAHRGLDALIRGAQRSGRGR
jgi:transcriptional regulator with XRE-family HTH domain